VRPEGLCRCKFPMAASGIEPTTSQLVSTVPQQPRHCVPIYKTSQFIIIKKTQFAPILNLMNPFHKDFVFEVDFNTLLQSTLWSSKFSLSFMIYHQKTACNFLLAMRATCPANLIFLHLTIRTIICEEQYAETPSAKTNDIANNRSSDVTLGRLVMSLKIHLAVFWVITCTDCTVSSLRRPYCRW